MGTISPIENKIIWVLEDDAESRFIYEQILDYRYHTKYLSSIAEFVSAIRDCDEDKRPQMIIADLMLEDGNYLTFLTNSSERDYINIPFIVVSSIDDIDALRFCFKEGALDYLTKPFRKNELLVKVENVLSGSNKRVVQNGEKGVTIDGIRINNLTSKQLQLLNLFLQSENRTVNRSDILERVWGDTAVHPKTVDVHLYNLRRKLHSHGYMIRSDGGGQWSLLSEKLDPKDN